MSFEVVVAVEPDKLRITAQGNYSFDKVFDFIKRVRSEADKANRRKVLIDCSRIEGKMTEVDRFEGGQHLAAIFGSRIHAVLVMPKGEVTKLGEMTAVNRGAVFFVTDCVDEAEQWLRTSHG